MKIVDKLEEICQQLGSAEDIALIGQAHYKVKVEKGLKGNRYFVGETRTDRETLLTLLCDNTYCPRSQEVKRKFHPPLVARRVFGTTTSKPTGPKLATLAQVVDLGQGIECREAHFSLTVTCPHGVHQPIRVDVKGWDVYQHGKYVAGGMVRGKPMFSRPEEATVFLD